MADAITFKSVGKTKVVREEQRLLNQPGERPIGLKTPLQSAKAGEGVFAKHYSIEDQIHDNLRNLIYTNHGERLCLYDFGANLQPLMTELSTGDEFDIEAMSRIRRAVGKWMPFIELGEYTSSPLRKDNQHVGKLRVVMLYSVPALRIRDKALEIILHVI